jgi:flavin-dependent dehydrogenase
MRRAIHDALIVGAGPAGATAARLLARAGWDVVLAEKADFPRRKVCGEFLSAATLPLLADSVGGDFATRAGPEVRRVGFYAKGAMLASPMPRSAKGVAFGRALGREHLDLLLRDAAVDAGATLVQPAKLVALARQPESHRGTLKTKDGTTDITARLVIAACGSWEPSVFAPGGPPPHRASDLLAFKAHFFDSDLPADLMPLLVFPGGYGGMVTSDAGRATLSCCIRRDVLAAARAHHPGSAADAVLAHIAAHTEGVTRALAKGRREGAFLAAGPIRPGIRARYRDRIFFAGNLAGEAHPIIAEGISMAIQGASLLAQTLIATGGDVSDAALGEAGRAYARAWKRQFATRIRAAGALAQFAARPRLSALGVPVVERFPRVLTLGAWISGKVNGLPA